MSDADLIYNALLRAEKRLELPDNTVPITTGLAMQMGAFHALKTLREEIGNGLAKEGR